MQKKDNSKKKIAILHPHITVKGGAIKILLQVANDLQNTNQVDFFTFDLNRNNCFLELNKTLNIINLKYKGIKKIYGVLKLGFILRKYDVILAGNTPMHFAAGIAKMFNKKLKVIWFCQNIPVYYMAQNKGFFTSIKGFFEKQIIIPFIDKIIVNSKFIQDEIKKYFNKNSQIIYPCVDTNFFINNGKKEEQYSLFTSSRLVKGKNIELAIETFIFLKNKYPKLKLYIAGDGEEKKNLQKLAKNQEGIIFLGEISQKEVKKYYEKCSIFLFTSLIDAFGITIIEAMAMNKPVISLANGGSLEIIKDGINGFLAKNKEEFFNLTNLLIKNKNKRISLGKKGKNLVEKSFSQNEMLDKFKKLVN